MLRWQKLPEFQIANREARRAAHNQSIARLQQATSTAVTTLLKVMVDPSTPASTKVQAADSILNRSGQAIGLEDIEVRVAELKRRPSRRSNEGGYSTHWPARGTGCAEPEEEPLPPSANIPNR